MRPTASTSVPRPWWQGAVAGFAEIGRRWLRARYPSLQHRHDDVLGEAALQLTILLTDPGEQWPPAWFGFEEPAAEDLKRFHGLAFTVLSRRVQDEFRRDVGRWLESLDEVPEDEHPVGTAPDAATALGLKRTVHALLTIIQAMSQRDQVLVERVALGDRTLPLSGAERERISQLRRCLRVQLQHLLGDRSARAETKPSDRKSKKSLGDGSDP